MSSKLRFVINITYKNGLALQRQYSKKQGAIMNARLIWKQSNTHGGNLLKVEVVDRKTKQVVHTEA